jgi:hypothetical protein
MNAHSVPSRSGRESRIDRAQCPIPSGIRCPGCPLSSIAARQETGMEPQGYRLPGCKDSMAFAPGEHQLPKLSRFPRRCVSPHVPGSPGAASLLKANRHPVIPPRLSRPLLAARRPGSENDPHQSLRVSLSCIMIFCCSPRLESLSIGGWAKRTGRAA